MTWVLVVIHCYTARCEPVNRPNTPNLQAVATEWPSRNECEQAGLKALKEQDSNRETVSYYCESKPR
jgi:hypothetical protein